MSTAWDKGSERNKQCAVLKTMELFLTGVRDGLSKEVTFKLDLNVKKELTMTSWRQDISGRGTASTKH